MEDIIKRIVEFDSIERKMIAGAEENQLSAETELSARKAKIHDDYMARADEKIKAIEAQEKADAEQALKDREILLSKQMDGLNNLYTAKKDEWVNELYERVVK